MKKVYKISIISSFLGLWVVSFLDKNFQTLLGFFLIFTFGVFHGANDLILFSKMKSTKAFDFAKTLLAYVLVVLTAVLVFIMFPQLALLCFIIVSGYHFGQQQFESFKTEFNKRYFNFFYLIYGLFVLMLLFMFNKNEVIEIVAEISGFLLSKKNIVIGFWSIAFLLLAAGVMLARTSIDFLKVIVLEIFFLMVFAVLFYSTTLIWGFALYFILWHSLPSIESQINFVHGECDAFSVFKYAKSGFLYWIVSMAGIAILYFWFREEKIFDSIFFSFLAAITFPHVFVIQEMFASRRSIKQNL